MDMYIQGIVNGLMLGWVYVLVALGLTIVFSIMRIVQFSHGEIYMLGAYCAYYVSSVLGFNMYLSFVAAIAMGAVLGFILERFLFRPFRGKIEPAMIVAIGLILLFQTAAVVIFGPQEKWLPTTISGVMVLGPVRLSWSRVLAVGACIVIVVLLFLFIRMTKLGKAMRAVSIDRDGAALQGIDVNRISVASMVIGCSLAAVAGVLMGSISQLNPFIGGFAMSKGIAVIILGGLGSIPGAVVGGLILGIIDGLVPLVSNSIVASMVGFLFIIAILVARPRGLLGVE